MVPQRSDAAAVADTFAALTALIYARADADSVYRAITGAAVDLVDGCDHASLLVRRGRRYTSVAPVDDVARRIDAIEVEVNEGPCVDAITDEAYQHDTDLTRGATPWPAFRQRILSETPVRSAIAYRLLVQGEKRAALNLFSDAPGGLSGDSADQGAVLAAFSSIALATLEARVEVETLRTGLYSNREIGKAVGLLMAAHRVPADDAFDILRRTSQDLNIKLATVAEEVVQGQQNQFPAVHDAETARLTGPVDTTPASRPVLP
jgi:hypothetical protein